MSKNPSFMMDDYAIYYTIAPGNIITGSNLKYLLACLNSRIFYFALRKYYMGGGIEGELKTNRLLMLPIPEASVINRTYLNQINLYCSYIINQCNEEYIINELSDKIDCIITDILNISKDEYSYIVNYKF